MTDILKCADKVNCNPSVHVVHEQANREREMGPRLQRGEQSTGEITARVRTQREKAEMRALN
jgi:hypothetical protein